MNCPSSKPLAFLLVVFSIPCTVGYTQAPPELDIRRALAETQTLGPVSDAQAENLLDPSLLWWDAYISQPYRAEAATQQLTLQDVLYMALQSSEQIRVYSETPLIRETAITEAAAAFDWTRFAETYWNDISEPVGNTLTIGGPGNRFLDQKWTGAAGVRRRTMTGGQIDISQQLGWQDNNSTFFVPNDQATTQLSIGFMQPLMKGRGRAYNQSLIVLAQIDTSTARDEYSKQLQSHLLEVIRAYRTLQLERASLVQRVKLFQVTRQIYDEIAARQKVDAQPAQLVSSAAALESRRTDLIRARAAVKNAETKLRVLCNHSLLGDSDAVELVPVDPLTHPFYTSELETEMSLALQNRPEISATLKEIRAACVRTDMAQNEILPQLNLVTRAYVNGLEGNSRFGQSWTNQFSDGRPSYSIGLVYELPAGNRAAQARLTRRQIEIRPLQAQYRSAIEAVKAEVDIALRELQTSHEELAAKSRTLSAAKAQADTLQARWKRAPGTNGTGALTLESLLDAQQRITEAEASLVTSQLTYSLSVSNLYRANGTLLQVQDVRLTRVSENCLPRNVADTEQMTDR
jgi:outer membrane protein